MDKGDDSWKRLEGGHERLRWARSNSRFETAADFARSIGMKEGTYRAYERPAEAAKHTPLDDQAAIRFARKLKISWEWLLTGEGSPWPDENIERVRIAMEARPEAERGRIADAIEALLRLGIRS